MNQDNKFWIIDSHMHIRGVDNVSTKETLQGISAIKEQLCLEAVNVASIPQWIGVLL